MKISNELLRNYLISRRGFVLLAGKLSMLSMLALRMLHMQIVDGSKYRTLSDKNRISIVMLPPHRGKILDIDGRIIADSTSAFRVLLDKTENPKYKNIIEILCDILNLSEAERKGVSKIADKIHKKFPSPLIDNLTWQQVSIVEENIGSLPGIFVDVGQYRTYPYGQIFSHPLGYISTVTEQDKKDFALSNIGDFAVGKNGIERFYEEQLRGEFGMKEAEVNAHGTVIREITSKPSTSGSELQLNIDLDIQQSAMKLLPSKGGSIIVIDLESGKLLTIASSPGYDPNKFVRGLSIDYWNEIIGNPYKPLINKTVQTNYPPGSIFKIITVLAALESGMDPNIKIHCTGGSALGDSHFKCWYRPGHGDLDLQQAIQHSCNSYMFHIAKTIGTPKIIELARKFGFGDLTGIDLSGESAGLVPDPLWKKKRFKQDWRLGDSLNTAIGQGFLLATPIQMARFCAAIATGGKLFNPRIFGQGESSQIEINPEHMKFIQASMYDVMNLQGGTAFRYRIAHPKWEIAGKTATSQVKSKVGDIDLSSASVPWGSRNHAMFMCYGPAKKPRFATLAIVDHGGGGSAAAMVARDLMIEVFRKYL